MHYLNSAEERRYARTVGRWQGLSVAIFCEWRGEHSWKTPPLMEMRRWLLLWNFWAGKVEKWKWKVFFGGGLQKPFPFCRTQVRVDVISDKNLFLIVALFYICGVLDPQVVDIDFWDSRHGMRKTKRQCDGDVNLEEMKSENHESAVSLKRWWFRTLYYYQSWFVNYK